MCGRYGLYEVSGLEDRFKAKSAVKKITDNYNVAPGQTMPVVVSGEDGNTIRQMKWGLIPSWTKDPNIGYKMINARSETIFDKPSWRGPIKHTRCLVPARGFYEWDTILENKKKPEKQPYYIKPKDQVLFAFAGVYSVWHDADNKEVFTYSIVTTSSNEDMQKIHDRMPVILKPEDEDLWLDPSVLDRGVIETLLRKYDDGMIEMFKVSRDVNTVRNNDNHLIYPINSQ